MPFKFHVPWQLPVYTSELNFLGFPPTLILEQSGGLSTFRVRATLAVIRTATAWAWVITPKLTIGALVLLGVSLLAHAVDCGFSFRSGPAVGRRDVAAYCVAHVSLVNFVLDVPGIAAGIRLWWHHALLVCTNLAAVAVVAVGFTWAEDWAHAWHCYGTQATLNDLEYGYCLTWPGVTAPPRGICDAGSQTGPHPGCAETSIPRSEILGRTFYVFAHIVVFSAAVYVGMVPAKLRAIKN
jgi:hypothetical protein